MLPALEYHLEAFGIKPLSAAEAFGLNREMSEYKTAMSQWWSKSSSRTNSGRPFDAIIAPVHPSTSYPHNFASWWGYTTIWNILDYPSLTIPIRKFKISAETDPKDLDYKPIDNKFDRATYEMCKSNPMNQTRIPLTLSKMTRSFSRINLSACKSSEGLSRMKNSSQLQRSLKGLSTRPHGNWKTTTSLWEVPLNLSILVNTSRPPCMSLPMSMFLGEQMVNRKRWRKSTRTFDFWCRSLCRKPSLEVAKGPRVKR